MKEPNRVPKNCEWTREKTASLITLYQSHQCLWNNFIEAYKNKDKRIKAVDAICSRLNITKVEFGKKIHNLRNQFNAEMKKLDKRNESSTEVYRSRWEHYDALKFLREVIAPRPGYSMPLKGPRKYEVKYSIVDDEEQQNANEIHEPSDSEIQYEETTNTSERNPLGYTSIPIVSREEILETKYHRPSEEEMDTQEYIQAVQQPQHQIIRQQQRQSSQDILHIEDARHMQQTTGTIVGVENIPLKKRQRIDTADQQQRDQWDVFGEFVAAEFRNLNTELSRKKLKRKIMQVMLEVGEEDDGININISLN